MTQDHLNSLCNFCFAEALPAEWERRREKRLQAVPSLYSTYSAPNGSERPTWLLDLTKAGVGDWSTITVEYSPIGEVDGRVIFSPSLKDRSDLRAEGYSSKKGIIVVLRDALVFPAEPLPLLPQPETQILRQQHPQKTPAYIADMRTTSGISEEEALRAGLSHDEIKQRLNANPARRPAVLSEEDAADRRKRVMQGRMEAAQALWQSFRSLVAQKGLTPGELRARFEQEHPKEADLLRHHVCKYCGKLTPKPGRICAKCKAEEAA